MKVCSKCGHDLPASAWSCPGCGEPIPHHLDAIPADAPAEKKRPAASASSKIGQTIFAKLPPRLQDMLKKCGQNAFIQIALQKIGGLPKTVKIIGLLFFIVAAASTVHAITADEIALKAQANEFITARNSILLGSTDTTALGKVGQNLDPEYKHAYIDALLSTGSKNSQVHGDLTKNIKVNIELQSVEIDKDKQHAVVNYLINLPINLDTAVPRQQLQIPLKNGILQLEWIKISGKWYFNGEKIND